MRSRFLEPEFRLASTAEQCASSVIRPKKMRKYTVPVESRPAVPAFVSADRLKLQTHEHPPAF